MDSRRNYLVCIAGSVLATVDEIRGIPQLKLSELDKLPDDRLARIIPKIDRERTHFEEKTATLFQKDSQSKKLCKICEMDAVERTIWYKFSEAQTIQEVANWAAVCHKINIEEAFRSAKGLFLKLSGSRVCFPANRV